VVQFRQPYPHFSIFSPKIFQFSYSKREYKLHCLATTFFYQNLIQSPIDSKSTVKLSLGRNIKFGVKQCIISRLKRCVKNLIFVRLKSTWLKFSFFLIIYWYYVLELFVWVLVVLRLLETLVCCSFVWSCDGVLLNVCSKKFHCFDCSVSIDETHLWFNIKFFVYIFSGQFFD